MELVTLIEILGDEQVDVTLRKDGDWLCSLTPHRGSVVQVRAESPELAAAKAYNRYKGVYDE